MKSLFALLGVLVREGFLSSSFKGSSTGSLKVFKFMCSDMFGLRVWV